MRSYDEPRRVLHCHRRSLVDHRPANNQIKQPAPCMRYAARFSDNPPEAEINVYQHVDGHDPRLVARRRVADRFWKYVKDN
jgi:hypothetical protein